MKIIRWNVKYPPQSRMPRCQMGTLVARMKLVTRFQPLWKCDLHEKISRRTFVSLAFIPNLFLSFMGSCMCLSFMGSVGCSLLSPSPSINTVCVCLCRSVCTSFLSLFYLYISIKDRNLFLASPPPPSQLLSSRFSGCPVAQGLTLVPKAVMIGCPGITSRLGSGYFFSLFFLGRLLINPAALP